MKNLVVVDAKDGKLDLTWDPATDNVGVDHYKIFRDNVFITNTSNTNFRDSGLINNQMYVYTVRAVDTSGNLGEFSDPQSGTPTKTTKSNPNPNDPEDPNPGNVNYPPIADGSAGEPYVGIVNEEILFNGSKSYDPEHSITKYLWDFGDGNTSLGEIVTHSYSTAGKYKVILTVWDPNDNYDSYVTSALIDEPNSPPSRPNVTGPSEGFVNVTYTFIIVSNDSDSSNIKYIIDWGDGNVTESSFKNPNEPFSTYHKWTSPGSYIISVS